MQYYDTDGTDLFSTLLFSPDLMATKRFCAATRDDLQTHLTFPTIVVRIPGNKLWPYNTVDNGLALPTIHA